MKSESEVDEFISQYRKYWDNEQKSKLKTNEVLPFEIDENKLQNSKSYKIYRYI